jgi:hypothetical protein
MTAIRHPSRPELSADDLNQRIGVLTRREVEARLLAPLVAALGKEFGSKDSTRRFA